MILEGGWEVAGIRQDESRYKKAGEQEDIHLSFLYLILKCSALFVMLPTVTSPSDKPLDFGISKLCARIKPSILSPFHFAYFKGSKKVLKL